MGAKVRLFTEPSKQILLINVFVMLLNIKPFPASRGWVDALHEEYQFVPSELVENRTFMSLEYLATDATNLHTLVIYHITTTLPVKKFHQRAMTVEVDIHTTVGWLHTTTARKPAQRLYSFAKVYACAVDHKFVRFVQAKHSSTYFAAAKVRSPWQMQNTSKVGWLRMN